MARKRFLIKKKTTLKLLSLWILLGLVIVACAQPAGALPGDQNDHQLTTSTPSDVPNTSQTGDENESAQSPRAIPTPTEAPLDVGSVRVNAIDGAAMVYVPAGEFIMGSEALVANQDEKPEHVVVLDAYWIYQYEVTNTDYARFLNTFGNQNEGGADWLNAPNKDVHLQQVDGVWTPDAGYADHPVVTVTWYGARAYCEWVGGRLPTEAEWEKAARGEDGRTFPWGEERPNCDLANFNECVGTTVPVGSYPEGVSPYGVYDMAGNAWEWVSDWYSANYYQISPERNPQGPERGTNKVLKGGGWAFMIQYLRSTERNRIFPNLTYCSMGFRCVLSETP